MALDKTRRIDMTIDKLTGDEVMAKALYAMTGTYNGTQLRVQLTNGGVVEPQNARLQFGFVLVKDETINGVFDFTVIDADTGVYEVSYPSEMLKTEGVVLCAIKIIESGHDGKQHIMKTNNFKVKVIKSAIDDTYTVAENSLTVFDKMLIDIADHERRVIYMEMNFKAMAELLTKSIPNMDVPVSTRSSDTDMKTSLQNDISLDEKISAIKKISDDYIVPKFSNPSYVRNTKVAKKITDFIYGDSTPGLEGVNLYDPSYRDYNQILYKAKASFFDKISNDDMPTIISINGPGCIHNMHFKTYGYENRSCFSIVAVIIDGVNFIPRLNLTNTYARWDESDVPHLESTGFYINFGVAINSTLPFLDNIAGHLPDPRITTEFSSDFFYCNMIGSAAQLCFYERLKFYKNITIKGKTFFFCKNKNDRSCNKIKNTCMYEASVRHTLFQ